MHTRTLPLLPILALAGGIGLAHPHLRAAAEPPWKPVAPADLAATRPEVESDAPAEFLVHEILIDDRAFPAVSRARRYLQLKIFDTTNIENLTRVSERTTDDEVVTIHARLTRPDGTITEFGADAVRERVLSRPRRAGSFFDRLFSGESDEVKEKFLAITGITAGDVLDIVVEREAKREVSYATYFTADPLQRASIPSRRLVYTHIAPHDDDYTSRVFLLNAAIGSARLDEDTKKRTTTITASRVPALVDEPFSGPAPDDSLTILRSYSNKDVMLRTRSRGVRTFVDPRKDGPWAPIAALYYVMLEGNVAKTPRVTQLAKELVAGAATPEDGAARIHDHVRALYQEYRLRTKSGEPLSGAAGSLDDVLDWKTRHERWLIRNEDFGFLAYALYREAGYDVAMLLVPDRRRVRFDQTLVSAALVPEQCLGIRIGDSWHFSQPTAAQALPFGLLPWWMEGQAALRVKDGREEFVGIPYTPAERSIMTTSGELRIDSAGTLSGQLTRRFTGHTAWLIRSHLRDQPPAEQMERLRAALQEAMDFPELEVVETRNLDEVTAPLEVDIRVRRPDYATAGGGRMIVRPAAGRMESRSPFPADTRRADIQFPFAWRESDQLVLVVPDDYRPTALPPAKPIRHGRFLACAMQVKFDTARNGLVVRREYGVLDWLFDRADYAGVKGWFDAAAAMDATEIVLTKDTTSP